MSDTELEAAIAATNPPGPRVTLQHIESLIVGEYFFTAAKAVGDDAPIMQPLKCLTFCVLVLRNGFTVTGESACADPANFNQKIGERIARDNAMSKIWAFEGYLLRERLTAEA